MFGISADRISQVALSTPLAQGQLPDNPDSAVDHLDLRRRHIGHRQQIVGIVPDFLLRLEREERGHPAEAHRERAAPAGAAAGAAKLEADLRKLGGTVFVTAESLRLHDAKDIRVAQRVHCLDGDAPRLLRAQRTRS